jgi:hypothetical protein
VSPSRPSVEVGEDRTDRDAHLGTINKLRRVLMVHMIAQAVWSIKCASWAYKDACGVSHSRGG